MTPKPRKPDEVDRIFEGINSLPTDADWELMRKRIRSLIARREKKAHSIGYADGFGYGYEINSVTASDSWKSYQKSRRKP